MKQAFKAHIYGRVQGVWFRKHTQMKARELGIAGIVRNEPDGSVYVEAEGPADALEHFRNWLRHQGSPLSEIVRAEFTETEPRGRTDFLIVK